eukprot:6187261-Pleurochrysis_carterae.AAC.3
MGKDADKKLKWETATKKPGKLKTGGREKIKIRATKMKYEMLRGSIARRHERKLRKRTRNGARLEVRASESVRAASE